MSGFASRQEKENPNVLIGNPSGYQGQTDCLLFFPSPTLPPPEKPDQFPATENNSFNNDCVSNNFLYHNSPHTAWCAIVS